jgi:4-amino-4-deoxy-L-arabinose transferase-like glycosyltransferase
MKTSRLSTEAPPDSHPSLDNSQRSGNHVKAWRRDFLILGAILVFSLLVRVAALLFWGTGPIESEGAEYARIAENLRRGLGYVGMATPGTQLNFPPLFPLLISGVSFITGSYMRAGRCVALAFGALVPLPVFGIASQLFSRRTAFVAAVLAMLHPVLISLSLAVYSEGPYAMLCLTAVYFVLCALSRPSMRMWCLVGAVFGLAFLVRVEAFAALLVAVFFALTATQEKLTTRCQRAASAILMFLLLATPEVILIYHSTGKLRLEAKSAIQLPMAIDWFARGGGQGTSEEAALVTEFGIDENLNTTGTWMRSNSEVVRESHVKLKAVAHLAAYLARRNTLELLQYLSARWMGAPFLTALALLGALRRPWRQPIAARRLFFMLVPVTAVAATLSLMYAPPRYFLILIPFLLIWAANGLVEIGLWLDTSLRAQRRCLISPLVPECIILGLIGMGLVIYPKKDVRELWEFAQGSPARNVEIDVGLWIKHQQGAPVRIMDRDLNLPFHADAEFVWFPYCSSETALRFLDVAKVDYVILRRGNQFAPYYVDWLTNGIPDARAQRVYTSSSGEIVVYRWHWSDKPSSRAANTKTDARSDVVAAL